MGGVRAWREVGLKWGYTICIEARGAGSRAKVSIDPRIQTHTPSNATRITSCGLCKRRWERRSRTNRQSTIWI